MTAEDARAILHAWIDRLPDDDLGAVGALIEETQLAHRARRTPADGAERRRRIEEHAGHGHYPPGYLEDLRGEWPA